MAAQGQYPRRVLEMKSWGPDGRKRRVSLLAVVLCVFVAVGCEETSDEAGETPTNTAATTMEQDGVKTLDAPGGLDADNALIFANRGPTELWEGLGTRPFEVSTDNEEARKYMDQGLAQVYGFQAADAYRSFRKASELDPELAMAHWGMALALGPDINYGIDANRNKIAAGIVRKAQSLADSATQEEQDYIAALSTRYDDSKAPDFDKLNDDYAAAMKKVAEDYPDDLDAATLYAAGLMWANWGMQFPHPFPHAEMEEPEDTREAISTLQSVIEREPDHVGAIHYYIHVIEQAPDPEVALDSAERLKRLAPNSPHVVHMASHIYIHDGDYAAILSINDDVFPALEAYRERVGEADYFYIVEGSHERRFVVETLDRAGRSSAAVRGADDLIVRIQPFLKQAPWLEDNSAVPILTRVHFYKWGELLKLPEPDTGPDYPAAIGFHHFGRTMAYAATGRPDEAEKESEALKELREKTPTADALGSNNLDEMLEIVNLVADARIARARGDHDRGIELLREAVEKQDALKYDIGYPIAPYSFRENLGGALLDADRPEEAADVFREDLELNPGNGRSWFGLAESLERSGDETGAWEARLQFDEAWRLADTRLDIREF
ncbi:MAG: hypothetical protein M3338_03910 [Actinomycetota bacterium]|nr:hypothetical protein [Actinomycetota bacterium]